MFQNSNDIDIRYQVMLAQQAGDTRRLVAEMARGIVDCVRTGGDATEAVMARRYGFTIDELRAHQKPAADAATRILKRADRQLAA